MSLETDIANGALVQLGERLILDINEATKQARIFKQRLPQCKKAFLRMHPWNFAKKRAVLAPDATTPAFNYNYQFTLPVDCLRLLAVDDEDDYKVEGRKILAHSDTLNISYVYDAPFNDWDALAVQCLSLYMAWDCCYAITDSNSLKEGLYKAWTTAIGPAKFVDSADEPPGQIQSSELVEAAYGYRRQRYPSDPLT